MIKADKSRVALRAFSNIAKVWSLTEEEQVLILGEPAQATFDAWRREETAEVTKDTIERISYVLGIFRAINTLLPNKELAAEWVRRPNNAPIFAGTSAVERMTAGNVSDLYVVRQCFDAEVSPLKNGGDRSFGVLRGDISIADDFCESPKDIIDSMEGL